MHVCGNTHADIINTWEVHSGIKRQVDWVCSEAPPAGSQEPPVLGSKAWRSSPSLQVSGLRGCSTDLPGGGIGALFPSSWGLLGAD